MDEEETAIPVQAALATPGTPGRAEVSGPVTRLKLTSPQLAEIVTLVSVLLPG